MRRVAVLLFMALAVSGLAPPAWASWPSSGSASASLIATTVLAGKAPGAPVRNGGAVDLSWDASTLANSVEVTHYDVWRHGEGGDAMVCEAVQATSCSDNDPMPGPVTYGVVPRIGTNWTGPESAGTSFQYDGTEPITSIDFDPTPNEAGWNKADVTVTLTAEDPGHVPSGVARIYYRVGNGPIEHQDGASATILVAGEQVTSISFWAVDELGNEETPKSSGAISIDMTAPTTTAELSPEPNASGWNKSDVEVTFDSEDALSGPSLTEFSLDGGTNWTTYAAAEPPTLSTEGEQVVSYRSIDVAGNVEPTQHQDVKIDTTAPTTSASVSPAPNAANWNKSDVTVTLTSDDDLSGVVSTEYSLTDGGAYSPYTEAISLMTEGETTVYFRSTDTAGNVETQRSVLVKLDKTKPDAAITPAGGTATSATITGSDSGNSSGVASIVFSVNGGTSQTVPGSTATINFGSATTTVSYHAVDNAGNIGDAQTATFNADTSAPTVTISGPTGDVNNRSGQAPDRWSQTCLAMGGRGVCGTASDSSGVAFVEIMLQRSDGTCWDGATWSATPCSTTVGVTGTSSWYRAIDYSVIESTNGLRLSARATDGAGNTSEWAVRTFNAE